MNTLHSAKCAAESAEEHNKRTWQGFGAARSRGIVFSRSRLKTGRLQNLGTNLGSSSSAKTQNLPMLVTYDVNDLLR